MVLNLHPLNSRHVWALFLVDFANYHEVRLVRHQRQHDQICVRSVKTMASVGVILRACFERADQVHHFVLTLSWHWRVGEQDLVTALVEGIIVELILHEPVQLLSKLSHKFRAWRDLVAVKQILLRVVFLACSWFSVFFESPCPLLVHLSSRSYSVQCKHN